MILYTLPYMNSIYIYIIFHGKFSSQSRCPSLLMSPLAPLILRKGAQNACGFADSWSIRCETVGSLNISWIYHGLSHGYMDISIFHGFISMGNQHGRVLKGIHLVQTLRSNLFEKVPLYLCLRCK